MTLMPSWAFRIAWFIPRIWARIFSEIASPAASSPARLILKPDESRSRLLLRLLSAIVNCRWVFIAEMLLTILITFLLLDYNFSSLPFWSAAPKGREVTELPVFRCHLLYR